MSDILINSGDPHEYAKARLELSFRDIVIEALKAFALNDKEFKELREYFSTGGGMTWNDILKAVQDDSEEGLRIVELFRQLTEAELASRGVIAQQADKHIPKWY